MNSVWSKLRQNIFPEDLFVFVWTIAAQNLHGTPCFYHHQENQWWLDLAEQKTITKPLITSSFNPGLPEYLGYLVSTILKYFVSLFKSLRGPHPKCINYLNFDSLNIVFILCGAPLVTFLYRYGLSPNSFLLLNYLFVPTFQRHLASHNRTSLVVGL